jgi:PEP-CTERM motif
MKTNVKMIIGMTSVAILLIGNAALAQVINGGFETASGAYTTGALGWSDNSGAAAGTTASATRSTSSPFAGSAELTLAYNNSASPGGGPASIAQSDIFSTPGGAETFSFEAEGQTIGFENNQWQIQWFGSGNAFLSASGFQSFQGGLTSSYSLQSFSVTAPAGTTGALIQFLQAGSAVPSDAGMTLIDNVSLSPVPEPTTLALAGLSGAAALSVIRRRK